MKKALIFLLTLAVVGAVFAQDNPTLKLSGSIQTGLEYYMGDDQADPNILSYADDAGVGAYRLRLAGDYVNGVTAAHFRISSSAEKDVAVDFVWADLNLLNNMVLIQAGYKVDDNAWRTKGDEEIDYDVDGGVKVHFKPIAGLDAGFALGVPNAAPGVKTADATYVLGLAYTQDMYSFQAGAKFVAGDAMGYYGGAEYTGIENLVLDLEAEMAVVGELADGTKTGATLADYSDFGRTEVVQSVEYTKDALGAGVYAYEWLYGNSKVDMGLKIAPYVSYTTGITTLKLEVAYNNDEYAIDKAKATKKADYSTLSVKPTATFQFNDKSKVVSGYEYVAQTDMAADNTQKLFVNFRYDF